MIRTERCLDGRLAASYPAAEHDVELQVTGVAPDDLGRVLREESDRILEKDPECRKVVFAALAADLAAVAAAESAGFRYVVDVDVPDEEGAVEELSLLVREPDFVTHVDMDLDHVPGT
ncbi:hypothetical protein ACJ5H2_22195 (plasmid) [Nocardioides sp. R1-1]|uniref:hypothetical protein n=1 Tax=Nocardioides sp. R1-1 TaxID=3383502 RepID=UPI0038D03577